MIVCGRETAGVSGEPVDSGHRRWSGHGVGGVGRAVPDVVARIGRPLPPHAPAAPRQAVVRHDVGGHRGPLAAASSHLERSWWAARRRVSRSPLLRGSGPGLQPGPRRSAGGQLAGVALETGCARTSPSEATSLSNWRTRSPGSGMRTGPSGSASQRLCVLARRPVAARSARTLSGAIGGTDRRSLDGTKTLSSGETASGTAPAWVEVRRRSRRYRGGRLALARFCALSRRHVVAVILRWGGPPPPSPRSWRSCGRHPGRWWRGVDLAPAATVCARRHPTR